jgi:hypothetical protein
LEGGIRGKMANLILTFVVVLCFLATVISFNSGPSTVSRNVARKIKMEYIPDGISKEKVRIEDISIIDLQFDMLSKSGLEKL